MHEIVIYENEPEKIAAIIRRCRSLAAQYRDIKFILFHSGSKQEVRAAAFNHGVAKPSRWVVFTPHGKGWRHVESKDLSEIVSSKCDAQLSGKRKGKRK